jgi:hypothetical protein
MNKTLITENINTCIIIFNNLAEETIDIAQFIDNNYFSQKKVEEITKKMNSYRIEEMKLEREFIKKVVNHIEFTNTGKEVSNNGSLYELFKSSVFNINLAIYYIDKKEEQSIVDFLINLLYEKYINESFFYLPQLW